jgi:hypothetical protein
MITVKADTRDDDVILTPKRQQQMSAKKELALQNLKELAKDNRLKNAQAKQQSAKRKQAKGSSRAKALAGTSPGSRSKGARSPSPTTAAELEEDRRAVAELPQIDTFPNDVINPLTKVSQRNYEENEAAPPRLDNFAISKIDQHGQFLIKNTELLPEDAKRIKLMEERQRAEAALKAVKVTNQKVPIKARKT